MPASMRISSRDNCFVGSEALTESDFRFTDIYEVILNDSSLVESELMELHKLILRKITNYKLPS